NSIVSITNTPAKPMEQDIADMLSRRYHRNARFFRDWNSDDVLQTYLSSLTHAYDPHSDYMGKPAMDQFAQMMNLSLFGIGAELSSSDDGFCTIQKLMPGGPAIKSGKLKQTDRIVAVAQGDQPPVDVVDMSINKVVQMIRGPKGTEVRLTVSPANSADRKIISLVRDEIPMPDSAAKEKLIELPTANSAKKLKIGVINLPSFYAPVEVVEGSAAEARYTSKDVETLLNKLKEEKVDGVILDLRYNGGGSLEESIKLSGLFIKDGPVVQVRTSEGSVRVFEDTDPSIAYDGPLIVLVNRFSASASEIFAGAMQDYGRAIIIGDVSTHGKGTVQNVNPLAAYMRNRDSTNDPGDVKITIQKFYRASGASTQFKGVMPDIVLPSPFNYLKNIGEVSLDYPLPWDTIPSAKFEPVNMVEPYLTELLKRSAQRVATNQDFIYVREDIDQLRKRQADKTAPLNEKDALKELEDQQARDAARDKERAARINPETVYEINLKQAVLPGLPPAVGQTNSVSTTADSTTPDGDVETPGAKHVDVDVDLSESERIMVDYLSLLSKNNIAAATKASSTP
ncbi:MAG TPA: carboxy terminal-processing peptidase, partial [Verrucomicrobiae bacterium]|nr:carboxy terminal-processing peptidase [Verrucomicrobiae bacterium]